jgi:hypothetical protein
MKVWRTIDNFLSKEEIAKVFTEKSFKPFTVRWHTLPSKSFYQNKILQEIKNDFTDLSSAVGIEEWHQDADWFLPEEHIDKDEALYETTGEVKLPLCSAILYLRVENLVGANLKLVRDNVEVTPKPGTLVLLSPGLLHSITDYESGKRISLNMNIWDSPPIIS